MQKNVVLQFIVDTLKAPEIKHQPDMVLAVTGSIK